MAQFSRSWLKLLPCGVRLVAGRLVVAGEAEGLSLVGCGATEEVNNHKTTVSATDTHSGRFGLCVCEEGERKRKGLGQGIKGKHCFW